MAVLDGGSPGVCCFMLQEQGRRRMSVPLEALAWLVLGTSVGPTKQVLKSWDAVVTIVIPDSLLRATV